MRDPRLARAMLLIALTGLGDRAAAEERLAPDELPCPVCGRPVAWKDIEGHLECPACRKKDE